MSYGVLLLRGDGSVLDGPRNVVELALAFAAKTVPDLTEPGRLALVLYPTPAPSGRLNPDLPDYLTPAWGYVHLLVLDANDGVRFRHTFTTEEVVAPGLRSWIAEQPEAPAGWRLVGPKIDDHGVKRPAPHVEGVTHVAPYEVGERRPFVLKPLPPPPPPPSTLTALGGQPLPEGWPPARGTRRVKVLAWRSLGETLLRRHAWSQEVEEGGFLLGRVYSDADEPGSYIAEVTTALQAQHTGASLLHFTFTGDSFTAIHQEITRNRPREQLLGWFHSHLFAANGDDGLSSIDYRLHFTTFRQSWQLAGLVNLGHDGDRVLRFYARVGDDMLLCPMQIIDGANP